MKKKKTDWVRDYLPWVILGLMFLVFIYQIFGLPR